MASAKSSKTVAPYGFWESPISTDLLLQKATALSEVIVPANSTSGNDIAWIELRMSESGRYALMHSTSLSSDDATDVTAGKFSSRSGVHEYGGGAAASLADGSFIFTDYNPKKWDVLRAKQGHEPVVVTEENAAVRYADFGPHPTDSELVLAIQEDHTDDTPTTVVNSIVLLQLGRDGEKAKVHTLLQGKKADQETDANGPQKRDFYTFARFSLNGKYVCWVSWNHPSMPWWDTQLWVAQIHLSNPSAPTLVNPMRIRVACSDPTKQQVVQEPVWAIPSDPLADESKLIFSCDATGYLNLYTAVVSSASGQLSVTTPEPILGEPIKNDFSAPCWTTNNSDFIPLSPDLLVVSYSLGARDSLGLINLRRPRLIPLDTPFVSVAQLRRLTSTSLALIATRADEPTALVKIELKTLAAASYKLSDSNITVIKRSSTLVSDGTIDKGYLAEGEEIEFPTTLPNGKPATAHAIIFKPKNKDYVAEEGTAPPCVFHIHGGPSASAGMGFNLQTQFWTSRGFMVCAVNFGGTTGYGRDYLDRLIGEWGVTDVIDCVNAAKFLGSKASVGTKSFGQLTEAEQRSVRKVIEQESAEAEAVSITHANGGVQVCVNNTTPAWGWMDLALATASVGVAVGAVNFASLVMRDYWHCIPSIIRPTSAASKALVKVGIATISVLPWTLAKITRVTSESVAVLPGLGVQLSTTRALSLFGNKHRLLSRTSSTLIPQDRVIDIYVAEAYRKFSVVDFVALVTSTRPSSSSSAENGATIQKLFPNLVPRLGSVQRIYRALAPYVPSNTSSASSSKGRNKKARSLADPNGMLISGGSAGGYTVLAALCFYPTIFSGGVSRYGISSLALLAEESHKFESQYPFQLIGGTPKSHPKVYRERSPIFKADHIKAPVLLLQGSDDKVVPQSQADEFVNQLKKGGGKEGKDWKYKVYEGEGHGFRRAENVKDSMELELKWWRMNCLK